MARCLDPSESSAALPFLVRTPGAFRSGGRYYALRLHPGRLQRLLLRGLGRRRAHLGFQQCAKLAIPCALDAVVWLAIDRRQLADDHIRATRHLRSLVGPWDEDPLFESEPMHGMI